jgi:hypothetical protein
VEHWLMRQEIVVRAYALNGGRRHLAGKQWRKKRVSLNLVHSNWAIIGSYCEISNACAHYDLSDDRTWHHRINPWGCRYPHVFAPHK